MGLRIASSTRDQDTLVLSLIGELELATAGRLGDAVRGAEATGARCILIDMEQLDYLDSAGLGALLRAKRYATAQGQELWAVGISTQPYARVLRSGLGELLCRKG